MRNVILAALLFPALAGCAAQAVRHEPQPMAGTDARAIVEQVFMEQPAKHRPAAVEFSDTYIALQLGTVSRGRAVAAPLGGLTVARGSSVSIDSNARLYFDTIAGTSLHHKRDWYVLDIQDAEGRILQRVYSRHEAKAYRFVDAIVALKQSSK